MSVEVDLPPELEANLAAQAAVRGMPLPEYLRQVLVAHAAAAKSKTRSPTERAAFWRASIKGLPDTEPLSDKAINRESIYAERG